MENTEFRSKILKIIAQNKLSGQKQSKIRADISRTVSAWQKKVSSEQFIKDIYSAYDILREYYFYNSKWKTELEIIIADMFTNVEVYNEGEIPVYVLEMLADGRIVNFGSIETLTTWVSPHNVAEIIRSLQPKDYMFEVALSICGQIYPYVDLKEVYEEHLGLLPDTIELALEGTPNSAKIKIYEDLIYLLCKKHGISTTYVDMQIFGDKTNIPEEAIPSVLLLDNTLYIPDRLYHNQDTESSIAAIRYTDCILTIIVQNPINLSKKEYTINLASNFHYDEDPNTGQIKMCI